MSAEAGAWDYCASFMGALGSNPTEQVPKGKRHLLQVDEKPKNEKKNCFGERQTEKQRETKRGRE